MQLPAPEPLPTVSRPGAATGMQPPQQPDAEEVSQEDVEAALCCLLLGTIQVSARHLDLLCSRIPSGREQDRQQNNQVIAAERAVEHTLHEVKWETCGGAHTPLTLGHRFATHSSLTRLVGVHMLSGGANTLHTDTH